MGGKYSIRQVRKHSDLEVVVSSGKSTDEIIPGQATSSDHGFTPEINHPGGAGERKFVVYGTAARFCASDPTKYPECKIPVIHAV